MLCCCPCRNPHRQTLLSRAAPRHSATTTTTTTNTLIRWLPAAAAAAADDLTAPLAQLPRHVPEDLPEHPAHRACFRPRRLLSTRSTPQSRAAARVSAADRCTRGIPSWAHPLHLRLRLLRNRSVSISSITISPGGDQGLPPNSCARIAASTRVALVLRVIRNLCDSGPSTPPVHDRLEPRCALWLGL